MGSWQLVACTPDENQNSAPSLLDSEITGWEERGKKGRKLRGGKLLMPLKKFEPNTDAWELKTYGVC